jgi:hypothetical protein
MSAPLRTKGGLQGGRFASILALAIALLFATPAPAQESASIWQRIVALFRPAPPPAGDEPCVFEGVEIGEVEAPAATPVVAVIKKAWEANLGGEQAARRYVRARLTRAPSRLLAAHPAKALNDRDFVDRVARDTWSGLEAMTDRINGLPINNIRLAEVDGNLDVRVGDYAGTTDIGLSLIATVAAFDLGYIDAAAAAARITRVLRTLAQLETHDGFFYNFYDTTSLERTSDFVSFVDSSWLTAGLMVARTTFPALHADLSRLIERTDYGFFYDDRLRQMSHGYYVSVDLRSRYHYGVLFAESRLGSLIAIGKGDAPEEHWFAMVRTFPASCDWQQQTPRGRRARTVRGHRVLGGWYEWVGLQYVPSWGGSMFEALMPRLLIDEPRYAPRSLGRNGDVHSVVQRRYAVETLGYPVWGLSPSWTPSSGYSEFGVPPLGSAGYKAGPVTPHAAALALLATPAEAVTNLRRLADGYDAYGEFGFYDAVDAESGDVAHTYLTLDQAMTLIAMANYLTDGAVQKRFAADSIAQRALPLLADEDFFE